jgi:hypothetical protein
MTKGAGAKSYMTKIFFPIYDGKFPGFSLNMMTISILGENSPPIFPIYNENLRTGGKVPLAFP